MRDLTFAEEFARAIRGREALDYGYALTKYVTGRSKERRAACIQTLQAVAELNLEELQGLLMWAKQQNIDI